MKLKVTGRWCLCCSPSLKLLTIECDQFSLSLELVSVNFSAGYLLCLSWMMSFLATKLTMEMQPSLLLRISTVLNSKGVHIDQGCKQTAVSSSFQQIWHSGGLNGWNEIFWLSRWTGTALQEALCDVNWDIFRSSSNKNIDCLQTLLSDLLANWWTILFVRLQLGPLRWYLSIVSVTLWRPAQPLVTVNMDEYKAHSHNVHRTVNNNYNRLNPDTCSSDCGV